MMRKRGQTVRVMIALILGLAVLFLMSYFLFREGGTFGKETAQCETKLGTCIEKDDTCDGRIITATCPTGKPTCCVGLMGGT